MVTLGTQSCVMGSPEHESIFVSAPSLRINEVYVSKRPPDPLSLTTRETLLVCDNSTPYVQELRCSDGSLARRYTCTKWLKENVLPKYAALREDGALVVR